MPEPNIQYSVEFPDGKRANISKEVYESTKDNLYSKYPEAKVVRTSVYQPDDDDIADSDQYAISFGGNRAVISNQAFQETKDSLLSQYPDAQITKMRDESAAYWEPRRQAAMAKLDELDKQNGDFMRQYNANKTVADLLENDGVVASGQHDFVAANKAQYDTLDRQRRELLEQYYSNPNTIREYREGASRAGSLHDAYMANADVAETGAERRDWKRAAKLQDDIRKVYEAPNKYTDGDASNGFFQYLSDYAKGAGDVFSDKDFYTRGFTEIARNFDLRGIAKKIEEASNAKGGDLSESDIDRIISPSEKAELMSFYALSEAQRERADSISSAYRAGSSFADSVGYMAEFLLSSGLGNLAGKAMSGSSRALTSWLGKQLMSDHALRRAIQKGVTTAPQYGSKAAKVLTEAAVKPLVQGIWHTGTQISSLANISEGLLETNSNGELVSVGHAILKRGVDSVIENWSESVGGALEAGLAAPFKAAGWLGEKTLGGTSFARAARWLYESGPAQVLFEAGFNGMLGEIAEEWVGNATRVAFGLMSKDEFKDFASFRQQAEMAASFAPMSLIGLGSSTMAAYRKSNQFKAVSGKVKGILQKQGVPDGEIEDLFNTKFDTAEDIGRKVAPYLYNAHQANNADDYKTILQFIELAGREAVFEEFDKVEKEQERSTMQEQIAAGAGQFWYDTPDNGSQVRVVETDGKTYYILGEGVDGTYAAISSDGERKVFSADRLAAGAQDGTLTDTQMALEDYLQQRVDATKKTAEAERMNREANEQLAAVKAQIAAKPEVNLGTREAPVLAAVTASDNTGVMVAWDDEEGNYREQPLTWNEVANKLQTPIDVRTDEQLENDAAAALDDARARVAQYQKITPGTEIRVDLPELGEATYRFQKAIVDEGQVIIYAEDENGESKQFTEEMVVDLPGLLAQEDAATAVNVPEEGTNVVFTDENGDPVKGVVSVKDNGSGFTSVVTPAGDTVVIETARVEQDAAPAQEPEDDGVLRDFRGNPIPMIESGEDAGEVDLDAFFDRDTEAWARWNDEQRGDGGADSRQNIEVALKAVQKTIKTAQKEHDATASPNKRRKQEQAIATLVQRAEQLQGLIDGYVAREEAAKAEEEARRAAAESEAAAAEEVAEAPAEAVAEEAPMEETPAPVEPEYNPDPEVAAAEAQVDLNPTDAQKEAGNYQKGHVVIDGHDITIENPKGSVRSGVDADGNPWSVTMNNTYGYIRRTEGVDGDQIDVFLSDNPTEGNVYVVDQVKPDGSFDEHKVMYGFASAEDAQAAYLANYSPGWKGLGVITEVSKEEFAKWLDSSTRKTKPFSEYKSVEASGAQNQAQQPMKINEVETITPQGIIDLYNSKDETSEDKGKPGRKEILNALYEANPQLVQFRNEADQQNAVSDVIALARQFPDLAISKRILGSVKTAWVVAEQQEIAPAPAEETAPAQPEAAPAAEAESAELTDAQKQVMEFAGVESPQTAEQQPQVNPEVNPQENPEENPEEKTAEQKESGWDQRRLEIISLAEQIDAKEKEIDELWKKWLNSRDENANMDERSALRDEQRKLENQLRKIVSSLSAEELDSISTIENKTLREIVSDTDAKTAVMRYTSRIAAAIQRRRNPSVGKAKPVGKVNLFKYTSKDDMRPAMTGVFHDKGFAVASDASILVADKASYDKKKEGKVVDKDGKPIKDVKYPQWRQLFNDDATKEAFNFAELRDFLASVRAEMEAEYASEKERNPQYKETKTDFINNTMINLCLGENTVISFRLGRLEKFADFAEHIGAHQLEYTDERRAVAARSDKGVVMLMPVLTDFTNNKRFDTFEEKVEGLADIYRYRVFGQNKYQKLIAKEVERQAPLQERLGKWRGVIGDEFTVLTGEDDVMAIQNKATRDKFLAAKEKGETVHGFYDPTTKKAYLYLPDIKDARELDRKVLHEVISHKGLAGVMGEEGFNAFLDRVWNDMMDADSRKKFLKYVNGSSINVDDRRGAADEYVAHVAEHNTSIIKQLDETAWDKFVNAVKEILNDMIGDDFFDTGVWTPFDKELAQAFNQYRTENAEAISRADAERVRANDERRQDAIAAAQGEETKATATRKAENNPQVPISQTQEKYEDFGEKIGWAKKDLAAKGFSRKNGEGDSRPAWRKKYSAVNVHPLSEEDKATARRFGMRTDFQEVPMDVTAKEPDYTKPFVGFYTKKTRTRFGERTSKHYITGEDRKPIIFTSLEQYEATVPVFEARDQGYRVRQDGDKFKIVRPASNNKLVEYAEFDTREEAVAYLASPEGCTDMLNRKRENYELPALEELTRNNMPDYRNGRNITPDEFQKTFGFRGGEFGNWNNAAERQQALNYAYDALMDLANVLGLTPEALTLGGELSIAFGARGEGGASAHYEPTKAVINLTKMKGAGSLAHEWAHALDNHFGLMDAKITRNREKDVPENAAFLSEGANWKKGSREEVRDAFAAVMKAINEKTVTRQIAQDKAQKEYDDEVGYARKQLERHYREEFARGLTKYKYNRKTKEREVVKIVPTEEQLAEYDRLCALLIDDPTFKFEWDYKKNAFRASGDIATQLYELVKDVMPNRGGERFGPLHNAFYYLDKAIPLRERLEKAKAGEMETVNIPTTLMDDSKWFDRMRASDYFAKDIELFARSFENYVSGEMRGNGQSSDYLTYEKGPLYEKIWGHNPYPAGTERADIKMAFDNLFRTIQEKTDENTGKRVLFSRAYHGTGADFELFDHSHMSEGEGNQAYGWGTYVAFNREVGLAYARSIGGSDDQYERAIRSIENQQARDRMSLEKAKNDAEKRYYEDAIALADKRKEQIKRHLYTVEIPDDDGYNYLHWDEPITMKQSRRIMDLIRENVEDKDAWGDMFEYELRSALGYGTYGSHVLGGMDYFLGNLRNYQTDEDPGAERNSKLLRSIGIVGMVHPAHGVNGEELEDEPNVVIYDENDLTITDHLRFSKVSDEDRARISAYDRYYGTDVLGFLDYVQNGWDGSEKSWKVARIKNSGFPTLIDAAKHGKIPVVGDLYIESDVLNPTRHAFHINGDKSRINPNHVLTQEEWAKVIDYLASESPKIIATAEANNLDAFALYPPFRHHNGLPMVVILEQAIKTKRAKKAYVITAFGEYDDVTKKKTFLYGSYEKVKGIPTVHVAPANPDTTTSWQIPSEDKDTKNLQFSKMDSEYLAAVESGDMEKAQELVNKAAERAMPNTKVVDENGKPLVVEHATNADFTTFEISHLGENSHDKGLFGAGFYFGSYAPGWMAGSKNLMRVYLRIMKPFEINDRSRSEDIYSYIANKFNIPDLRELNLTQFGKSIALGEYIDIIKSVNDEVAQGLHDADIANDEELQTYAPKDRISVYKEHLISERAGDFGTLANSMGYIIGEAIGSENFSSALKKSGYDGVIVERGGDYSEYVAFEPNQIKSAEPVTYDDAGNVIPLSERFNESNQDIRFSKESAGDIMDRYENQDGSEEYPWMFESDMIDRIERELPYGVDTEEIFSLIDKYRRLDAEDFNDGRRDFSGSERDEVFNDIVDALREYSKGDVRFSKANESQRIFISNAAAAAEAVPMDKATPEQWQKMLSDRGGMKAGEDKWLGLSDWLKNQDRKTITKQEVLDFINQNQIQIEEDSYGELDLSDLQEEFDTIPFETNEAKWEDADNRLTEFYLEMREKYGDDYLDKLNLSEQTVEENLMAERDSYEGEQDNIQSAYDAMVDKYGDDFSLAFTVDDRGLLEVVDKDAAASILGVNPINETRLFYTTPGLTNKHEIALTVPTIESWNVGDKIHFGDAGEGRAVAWIRFGDTMTEKGGDRILFIDEIQSKRHQEGREKGYSSKKLSEYQKAMEDAFKQRNNYLNSIKEKYGIKDGTVYGSMIKIEKKATREEFVEAARLNQEATAAMDAYNNASNSGIPAAPFEKNWHELAMKRMLRLAAEEGYDYVAWTTGNQQAERYDIGKVLDYIVRDNDYPDGEKRFEFGMAGGGVDIVLKVDNDANIIASKNADFVGKKLSDVVGKDIAAKMMALEVDEDIDAGRMLIGAEGMRGFYDQMLPAFMNKYGKKWGIQVEDINLPGLEESARTAHAVRVTPEMKESVLQGQLMFSKEGGEKRSRTPLETAYDVDRGGIKAVVGEENVSDFYNGLYRAMPEQLRAGIVSRAEDAGWNFHEALKGRLAELALAGNDETGMLRLAERMLSDYYGHPLDEATARYILWRTAQPNDSLTDIQKTALKRRWKVGEKDTDVRFSRAQFKAAFPDTKVVDENGEPLVVYHGTIDDFNVFERDKTEFGGFHFSSSKDGAMEAAMNKIYDRYGLDPEDIDDVKEAKQIAKQRVKIIPAFLNIKNLIRVDDESANDIAMGRKDGDISDESGYVYTNDVEGAGTDSYMVFSSNQIKLASLVTYDDNGNPVPSSERFNPENPDIRFSKGDLGRRLEETSQVVGVIADGAKESLDQQKKALKGELRTVARAMSAQKVYDRSTVDTITGLAKQVLKDQEIETMSRREIARLMGLIRTSVGKAPRTVKHNADILLDIIIDNLLRTEENRLAAIVRTGASRTNASGVEVQGKLDVRGQNVLKAYRAGLDMTVGKPDDDETEGTVYARLAVLQERLDSEDDAVRAEAEAEYDGLTMALEYHENIKASRNEERSLRDDMAEAAEEARRGGMSRAAYNEYVEDTQSALRENRVDRIESFRELRIKLAELIEGSKTNAAAFRQRERDRINAIHHLANSDMQGRTADQDKRPGRLGNFLNSSLVRFFTSPLATFDQMLRAFGSKSVNGQGYLWNKYMREWIEARENEIKGTMEAKQALDRKASEVFGKEMIWSDIYDIVRKMPKAKVKWWSGGAMQDHELTQGQLLYIYMVNKMADGRMKLRRMGISEEDVRAIRNQMDERFITLADWLQDEFLVGLRNKYNAVHERLFGASMAAIEDYFPLVINKRSLNKQEDIAAEDNGDTLPATTTGSIIKRRRNSRALDLLNADAFDVVIRHIEQMERWAAFAEYNRDLNTLLSYNRFRNQVKNMETIYGTGDVLWKNFRNVSRIAGNTYHPTVKSESLDSAAVNLAKGVTAAKINFRIYTAIKQFLSMPAFFADANIGKLAGSIAHQQQSWKWAMENLPLFESRWKSRIAGDTRLMNTDSDWKLFRSRAYDKLSKMGMSPNAFVDALTVSIGAKALYDTKYERYIEDGYTEEQAAKKAKQDATILYNETQQSSEGAFVSTVQLDRTLLSTMISVFRNSSMGFQRQLHDALRNLARRTRSGYREESLEFMTKQGVRDGLTEEQAAAAAEREYNRGMWHDMARVATFGMLVQFAWNLGASLAYLLFGDDDDKKEEMVREAFIHSLFGSIEGLSGGNIMSEALNMVAKGESLRNYDPSLLPIISDMKRIYSMAGYDKVAAFNSLVNLAVQAGIGANPETISDAVVAVVDASKGDLGVANEAMLLILRVLQVPQSQLDEIYIDELGMNARSARRLNYRQMADRYAKYKIAREAGAFVGLYSDEKRKAREESRKKTFQKKVNERKKIKK